MSFLLSLKNNPMSLSKYDHQYIEKKWQEIWEEKQLFRAEVDKEKPKYYILDMFPYPSGAGLHVGHVTGYTATDIIARYKRQRGYNVLHPMGWDSFGLPAEQYAIKTGTHPAITTKNNINTYRRQLKALGFSYDWRREVATSEPSYYKWTQWLFTKLYEKGLAYEAEAQVNFCPALGTVLANEEVENGVSKEGGHPVVRKPLRQWMLKITAYAERLIEDLDLVDWPEHLKKLQINWIGKSEGAVVHFATSGGDITVFTTRPDTLFGVSFLVLSPEHPQVNLLTTDAQKKKVDQYLKEVAAKSDLERTDLSKEKTGVFTGGYAKHPISDKAVPVWVSDFVLPTYGTGAVMAVPAHDERDFAFAKRFDIPFDRVIEPTEEALMACSSTIEQAHSLKREIEAKKAPWTGKGVVVNSHASNLNLDGLDNEVAKQKVIDYLTLTQKGKRSVSYKLRDWLFSRQRYWGEPFPILHFEDGSKRVLDLDELPLIPPEVTQFKPTESGESPLANARDWVNIQDDKTGKRAKRETNIMPQWAGSCWYYLRFCDPHNEKEAWNKAVEKYWMPVDLYVGGIEHAVLHLLYARFWHKVLYDLDLVSTLEPFQTLRNQGLVVARSYQMASGLYVDPQEVKEERGHYVHLGTNEELRSQVEKMSKSKLNGVTPDDIIEDYGADALRLYEMFMGPFDKEKLWNTDSVNGCRRFLSRIYDLVSSSKLSDEKEEEGLRLCHKVVHAVQQDIETMQFNTAIAKLMEFLNAFTHLKVYPKEGVKMVIQALYPFAPHLAEECWEMLGGKESLTFIPFPKINPNYLIDSMVTYVFQVNGKMRGSYEMPKDRTQDELLAFIQGQPPIAKHITGPIKKVVFVPNKLINLVIDA